MVRDNKTSVRPESGVGRGGGGWGVRGVGGEKEVEEKHQACGYHQEKLRPSLGISW